MTAAPRSLRVGLFDWRKAYQSELGPRRASDRHVLTAIDHHMNRDGENAWPSQITIASYTSLGRRTVIRSLGRLEAEGWIKRFPKRINGREWRRHEYYAVVPLNVANQLDLSPDQKADKTERSVTATPALPSKSHDGATQSGSCVTETVRGVNDALYVVPSFGSLTLPTNSPFNSPSKSRQIGHKESEVAKRFGEDKGIEIPEEARHEVLRLYGEGMESSSISKRLRVPYGLSTKQVNRIVSQDLTPASDAPCAPDTLRISGQGDRGLVKSGGDH